MVNVQKRRQAFEERGHAQWQAVARFELLQGLFAHVAISMYVGDHPTSESVMSMILVEGTDLEQAVCH